MTDNRVLLYAIFVLVTVGVVLGLPGCGGGGNPTGPSGGGATVGATVTLTANGVSDAQPRIAVGQRVRFTNNDSRVHTIYTTPHELHTDCPALNDIATLQPGQTRDSGVLNERKGCGFHDHNNPDDQRFRGQVLVGFGSGDPPPEPSPY